VLSFHTVLPLLLTSQMPLPPVQLRGSEVVRVSMTSVNVEATRIRWPVMRERPAATTVTVVGYEAPPLPQVISGY